MEQIAVTTLLQIIAGLMSVLIILIAWIGNRIFTRMDSMQSLLRLSEEQIHKRINHHETRITRVETKLNLSSHPTP